MRPRFTALLAAAILAGSMLPALADQCARPTEKTAFNVAGLKSQLMVTALSCQSDAALASMDKYNAFVVRYRTDLVGQERALASYFQRAYGRSGQKQHDDYITQLANSQSDAGIKSGSFFCKQNMGLFDEVMALKSGSELPSYAGTKSVIIAQPISLTDCPDKATKVKAKSAKK